VIDLNGDDTLQSKHLHGNVGSVNDRHELEEERPPQDEVAVNVEAHNFKCQRLLTHVIF
jgi:hypothetical protein